MNESASTTSGARAEETAANYLVRQGFKILDRNWRNRWCEIDIIAERSGTIRFVEVKYRKNSYYGSGLEYVTAAKQDRLKRAAEMWMTTNRQGGQYQIDVISITGNEIEYLPNCVTD